MSIKIDYFDCSSEADMIAAENIKKNKKVEKTEIVNFPHLMLIYED